MTTTFLPAPPWPRAVSTRWPGPAGPPAPAVLGAATAAGLVAAVAVPLDRPGMGWLVAGLTTTTAVVVARRGRSSSGPPSIIRQLWALGGLAMLSVGAIRAAEWLFALCVLTAGIAASLSVANGRSTRGMLAGLWMCLVAPIPALPWVAKGWTALHRRTGAPAARLIRAVLLAAGLAVLFGALFAGADPVFADLLGGAVPSVDAQSVARGILLFGMAAAVTFGACYLLAAPPDVEGPAPGAPRTVRRVEWMLPVGVLVVMFGSFVLLQLTMLFGGKDYMLRTTGLTAAEYARRGFWQLCVVTVLALVVIGVTMRRAPVGDRADRIWLRVLLGGLAGLTLVIVASALTRMSAYQEAYGYTVARVLVAACEVWLGAVYLMVLVAILRLRAPWLPRAVVSSALVALLLLAVVNPEGYVADRNVARYEHTGKIDIWYLSTLSEDAAQALARLPEPTRTCALSALRYRNDGPDPDGWAGWNLSRSLARELLHSAYLRPDPRCS